jgi:predicted membrane protein
MGTIILGTFLIVLGLGAILGISLIKFAFAFILIAIGIRIIIGKEHHKNWHNWDFKSSGASLNDDFIDELNIFSSANKTVKSENFKGGKVVMIFSSGKIDLSQVKTLETNIEMEIIVLFGGAELIIPKGWKINSQGTSVFGGYDTKIEGDDQGTILNLKGVALFGGVKVKN